MKKNVRLVGSTSSVLRQNTSNALSVWILMALVICFNPDRINMPEFLANIYIINMAGSDGLFNLGESLL